MGRLSFLATLSTAPEVGMLLATPLIFFFRNTSELAVNTASESEGVTKKCLPKIIFLSESIYSITCISVARCPELRNIYLLFIEYTHSLYKLLSIGKIGIGMQPAKVRPILAVHK
jgi:hypothetical protein